MSESEFQQAVFEQLRELREMVETALEGGRRPTPGPARADGLVGVDYFVERTGLARVTILQGKAGTKDVPVQSKRPRLWLRRDVDEFARARARKHQPARQKAIRLLDRTGGRKGAA